MTRAARVRILGLLVASLQGLVASAEVSTPEDRRALFEYLVEKTLQREAFSPIENERLGLDVEAALRAVESEILEGNPAEVAEPLRPTADNHARYYTLLLERAYAWLERTPRH